MIYIAISLSRLVCGQAIYIGLIMIIFRPTQQKDLPWRLAISGAALFLFPNFKLVLRSKDVIEKCYYYEAQPIIS